jgi:hypothetical protein
MKLLVSAIDPNRLCRIRTAGCDEAGNPLVEFSASGWEPLRCCLRRPDAGELIALISYSPFVVPSAWAETGPVFVHAEQCSGYGATESLPDELRTGPRILRTYYADGSLDYADITVVREGEDIEESFFDLLSRSEVAVVHVRALVAQCFTYAVTRQLW